LELPDDVSEESEVLDDISASLHDVGNIPGQTIPSQWHTGVEVFQAASDTPPEYSSEITHQELLVDTIKSVNCCELRGR